MQHPDLGADSRTTVDSKVFDLIWSKSGWVLAEDAMADETLAELRAAAAKADIPGRSSMSREELMAALSADDAEDQPED